MIRPSLVGGRFSLVRYNFRVLTSLVTALTAAVAALWLTGLIWLLIAYRRQPVLASTEAAHSDASVTVIVPARNEGKRILTRSVSSMLIQRHRNIQVVVVDDRSTDETGDILENLKKETESSRLTIVIGKELPEGWLGKPHALEQGLQVANGEWILTTDADIVFAPEAVGTAVSHAETNGYDALTLVPRLDLESFWERVFMPVFGWFCLLAMPLHRVNDPRRPESLGVGNFFLVRRSVLEKLGGFSSIRADVAEDLRLAEIIKGEGFRLRIETAPDLIRTRMYAGLSEMWSGFTKNLFSALKFSVVKGAAAFVTIIGFGVLPVVAFPMLFLAGFESAAAFCFTAYLIQILAFAVILKNIEQNPIYAVFIPLGFLIYGLILLNSMLRILSGKGVMWKGRSIYQSGGIVPPKI